MQWCHLVNERVRCAVGVSYLLPAEADRLMQAEQEKHEAQKARSEQMKQQRRRQPVVNDKHQPFIDDLVYVNWPLTLTLTHQPFIGDLVYVITHLYWNEDWEYVRK